MIRAAVTAVQRAGRHLQVVQRQAYLNTYFRPDGRTYAPLTFPVLVCHAARASPGVQVTVPRPALAPSTHLSVEQVSLRCHAALGSLTLAGARPQLPLTPVHPAATHRSSSCRIHLTLQATSPPAAVLSTVSRPWFPAALYAIPRGERHDRQPQQPTQADADRAR